MYDYTMKVTDIHIEGVKIIEPDVYVDNRGFFQETYSNRLYEKLLNVPLSFVQDSHSRSVKGTLRGLHLQKDRPQGKLVRVSRGTVFDVIVDIRKKSPTFKHWFGTELSDKNNLQLWIPPGFAHGFKVISEEADLLYKCTEYYCAEDEACIRWDDSELNIEWPSGPSIMSEKDLRGLSLLEFTK